MAAGASIHGITTAEPLMTATTVFGFAAHAASISASSSAASRRLRRSPPVAIVASSAASSSGGRRRGERRHRRVAADARVVDRREQREQVGVRALDVLALVGLRVADDDHDEVGARRDRDVGVVVRPRASAPNAARSPSSGVTTLGGCTADEPPSPRFGTAASRPSTATGARGARRRAGARRGS